MKRNRKVRKDANMACSMSFGMLIVSIFVGVMVFWSQDSRVTSISQANGEAERKLKSLKAQLTRETARWEEMKTPEKLENQLVRLGLNMRYAAEPQVVRMDSHGRPAPGQLSVVRNAGASRASGIADTGARPGRSFVKGHGRKK